MSRSTAFVLRSCRSTGPCGTAAGRPARSSRRCSAGTLPTDARAAQAARLVAILTELGLVSLDRDLPALTVLDGERTELERSATYRAAMQRYEDGRRWLTARRRTARTPA